VNFILAKDTGRHPRMTTRRRVAPTLSRMLATTHSFQYETCDIPADLTVSDWRLVRRATSQQRPARPRLHVLRKRSARDGSSTPRTI
jgi:hypothetical protein